MTNPSPDTSAAEVVARLLAHAVTQDKEAARFSYLGSRRPETLAAAKNAANRQAWHRQLAADIRCVCSLIDTSRAETAAAKQERDEAESNFRSALAVAEPWHNAYEVQLARADAANARAEALEREIDAMHKMRIKIPLDTIEKAKRVEPLEAKLAKAAEELVGARSLLVKEGYLPNRLASIDAVLTEIEGKSK